MSRSTPKRKSPLNKAYILLSAHSPRDLSDKYLVEDQKLMRAQRWDYKNPKLIINKARAILEDIDARTLSIEERHERRLILWFWYHHAISAAIWKYRDKRRARAYSTLALKFQPRNHPNHITRLLHLLIRGRLSEANVWVTNMRERAEKITARQLVKLYCEGGFFA